MSENINKQEQAMEQEHIPTVAELRAKLKGYVEELNGMEKGDVRRFEVSASALSVSQALSALATKEFVVEHWLTAINGDKLTAVQAVNAWLNSAMTAELSDVSFVETTKDDVTTYKVGDKKVYVTFENLDTLFQKNNGGFLACKQDYAKYVDLFLYTGRVYHRDREGKLDWAIPSMTDKARDLFNTKREQERDLKAGEKTWTNKSVNRDRYDRQMMEVIRAIVPDGFELPTLRKEDKRFIVDTLIQTDPKRRNYVAVKSVTMIGAIFASIYKAMHNEQYKHDAGDKASYDVIEREPKKDTVHDNGNAPTIRKETPKPTDTAKEVPAE